MYGRDRDKGSPAADAKSIPLTEPDRERPAFGALLRRMRLNANLSQESLAERARISVHAVSALERGARNAPQRHTLGLIADGLELGAADRAALEAAATVSAKLRVRNAGGSVKRSFPRNLPAIATSFLGRDREVAAIVDLLATTREVTVWGPGGVGKTRLALAASARAADAFDDGVAFVELATVVAGSGVASSVAAVLGIAEQVDVDVADTVVRALAEAHVLIVLDNCEHVLDDCARLTERLIAQAPAVGVLCTSREPLRIDGENVYELGPLPSSAAVRLFIERAAGRGVTVAQEAPEAVATICRRLDGIPLAIELAAARLPALNIDQIVRALDDRFRLLTRGTRTAQSRQQTLAGALDWSYDLLEPRERVVLRRVAILAGKWSLDDAFAVAGDPGMDRWAVIDAVSALVDKALIAVAQPADAQQRYVSLETTREYALARLRDAGEVARCERLRAQHVLASADAALTEWWKHRTEPERYDVDNLRAALHWSITKRNDPVLGAAIAGTLAFFWDVLGLQVEGMRWIDAAIALTDERDASSIVWLGRSLLARRLHLRHEAYEFAQHAVTYAQGAPAQLLGRALISRAYAAAAIELHDEASRSIDEAQSLFRDADDVPGTSAALHARAFVAFLDNRPTDARDALESVVATYRVHVSDRMLAHGLIDLAEAEFGLGNRSAAIARAREGVADARTLAAPQLLTVSLSNLAAYLLDGDDSDGANLEEALAASHEACALSYQKQFGVLTTIAVQVCALAAVRRGEVSAAAELAGYVELALVAAAAPREHTEQRTYDALMRRLRAVVPASELEATFDAGTVMSEVEAVSRALACTQPPRKADAGL